MSEPAQEKIRVLHVMHGFLHGGTERLMLEVLFRLPKDYYDVTATCLANQYLPDVVQEYQRAGVTTKVFSQRDGAKLFLELARFIRHGRFQIVHTHYHWENLWARLAAILVGVPIILTYQHVWSARERERHRMVFRMLDRWTYSNVTITEALRRYNIEQVRIPPHKVITVHNGIDTSVFSPPSESQRQNARNRLGLPASAFIVGSAGRLVEWKRFDLFLQAASNVLLGGRDAEFLVAGEGPQCDSLVDLALRLGIERHVHFLGWRPDMPGVYHALDAFCLVSESGVSSMRADGGEGFGLVSAEAMACEVPIVAVDTEVNREVISEECGLFCRPEAGDLAGKLCQLMDDPSLRRRLSESGRARVEERFCIDRTAGQLSDIYAQALQHRRLWS